MQYQPIIKQIRSAIASNNDKELLNHTYKDWVMIYLQTNDSFLNTFTVSNEFYDVYDSKDDFNLDFSPAECVSSCVGLEQVNIERTYHKGLDNSMLWPICFSRSIYERGKLEYKLELLQDFVHINGLFFDSKDNTFYLINDIGDKEVKALILNEDNLRLILIEKKTLDYYLGYSHQFLIRFFETASHERDRNAIVQDFKNDEIVRRVFQFESTQTFKIVELICPTYSIKQIEQNAVKKYEVFIIKDIKNNQVIDCSCNPVEQDSYYDDTGKPLQMSPVFFNPEVLSKYKSNHEKYEVNDRSINCYGAWSLRPYSINEEGQVQTYLYYLGQLPHKEQLHWKQYNEEPKANISNVAFRTDFLAQFDEEECALRNIKNMFKQFPKLNISGTEYTIWKAIGGNTDSLLKKLYPVITDNTKEYQDFLLNLTILIIDGLDKATLRELTNSSNESNSLLCLEKLLKSWNSEHVVEIMRAYRDLQRKRSKFAGHGGGIIDFDIKEQALNLTKEISIAVEYLIREINLKNKS